MLSVTNNTFFCITLLFILFNVNLRAQDGLDWKFKTNDKILSSPSVDNGKVYFGSNDNNFYCVNSELGTEIWKFTTNYGIRSKAVLDDTVVYFTSGNILYALSTNTGNKLWNYDPQNSEKTEEIDEWDYHRSSPVLADSTLFYGSGEGKLYGINKLSGAKTFEFATENNSPVRSTAAIEDSIVYFGDWDGKIYAVNIYTGSEIWSHKTFSSRPYDSYGAIVSKFLVHGDRLFFGARNDNVMALNKVTGAELWKYNDPIGSWISGTPVISNDLLIIAGSDNRSLLALNPENGAKIWQCNTGQHMYAEPIVTDGKIIITSGDVYKPNDKGKLLLIDQETGKVKKTFQPDLRAYSSPVMDNGRIIFGCEDGYIYAIDSAWFFNIQTSVPTEGFSDSPVRFYVGHSNLSIYIQDFESEILLYIFDLKGKMIKSEKLRFGLTIVDISNLIPGIYICRVEVGHALITRKLYVN